MENKKLSPLSILLPKAWKRQRFSICVTSFLLFISALSIYLAITLFASGEREIQTEMERLGFGDFTVWVGDLADNLTDAIAHLPDTGSVLEQEIIYAGYEANGHYSDTEGQLMPWRESVPYQFIRRDGVTVQTPDIAPGTIYISPAMESSSGLTVGDTIIFELTRVNMNGNSRKKSFLVAGYFADAFMGSSMIDMKSFLVSEKDFKEMLLSIENAGKADAMAKRGAMLHITKNPDSARDDREYYSLLQDATPIARYTEFTWRKESIASYMLLLQNILSGFLFIFATILFVVCMIITKHSLSLVIEQEKGDLAILKSLGLPGKTLRNLYFILYGASGTTGILLGMLLCRPAAELAATGMVSSTGMRVAIHVPAIPAVLVFVAYLFLLAAFLLSGTGKILRIAPIETIREAGSARQSHSPLHRKNLTAHIAVRELLSDFKKYISLLLIAALLSAFLCVVGRMGSWLGMDGAGLMDAFSVAEHDIGVQPFQASVPMVEIERAINWYSPITERYELAMESVTVEGQQYTANVLNDTRWFHLLKGELCSGDSILITDTVAKELSLEIGDSVRVSANGRTAQYLVSGIYQCANGMGANIGMSIQGYSQIGDITGFIWCYHYILEDGSVRDYILNYLQEHYTSIDVHTNAWSGLDGIVFVMHLLIVGFYLVAALVIFLFAALVSGKLLQSGKANMAIYKSLGMPTRRLRLSFALRFFFSSLAGSCLGIFLAGIFADGIIGKIFHYFGIGEFRAGFSFLGNLMPLAVLPVLFFLFAWRFSARLSRISIVELVSV